MRSINRLPREVPPTLPLSGLHFVGLESGEVGMMFTDSGASIDATGAPIPAMFKLDTAAHVRELIGCLEQAIALQWPGEPTREVQ